MKKIAISVTALAAALALPAYGAETITISDAYARASSAMASSGAAFMIIENHGSEDDRLIAAASDAAERVEIHTHIETDEGVMQMIELEEGLAIPAGGQHALERGGDHVMFMGLRAPFEHGASVTLTLTFEIAGDLVAEIPVDLERAADHGAGSGHQH